VFGQLAESRDNGTLSFVTTGDVARDILAMAEAMGQEKVQYYGMSYVEKPFLMLERYS
jgi:hypothetical protein